MAATQKLYLVLGFALAAVTTTASAHGKVDNLLCEIKIAGSESFAPVKLKMPIAIERQTLNSPDPSYTLTKGTQEWELLSTGSDGTRLSLMAFIESFHARRGNEARHFRCITLKLEFANQSMKFDCAPRPKDPFQDPTGAWSVASIGADGHPNYVIRHFNFDLQNTIAGPINFKCSRQ